MTSSGTVTKVKNFRVVAVIAALAASALTMAAIVFTQTGGTTGSNADTGYWAKRWHACENKAAKTTDQVMEESYDCLRSAIRDAVTSGNFEPFVAAGQPILDENIMLAYVCHIPGHDLGPELLEHFGGSYSKAIKGLNANICGSGIVHGVVDVWGKSKHSPEAWLEISQACIEANMVRYNACGDAMGHSAYESMDQNLGDAIGICNTFSEAWIRNSCSNGAFMQSQYPQSSALKQTRSANMPENWSDLITFCDSLTHRNEGTMDGCYGGAGWVMGNTIFHELQEMQKLPDEKDSTPEQDAFVVERIKYAMDACESTGAAAHGSADVCSWLMLARMPLFFYLNIEKFEKFCETVSVGRKETMFSNCLASGQEHISPEQKKYLRDKYPEVAAIMDGRNPLEAGLVGKGE